MRLEIGKILFASVMVLSVLSVTQMAFAQEDVLKGIYNPTSDALSAFAVNVANNIPKVIAAVILLVIGFIAGKIVGRVVTRVAKNLLQKTRQQAQNSQILDGMPEK